MLSLGQINILFSWTQKPLDFSKVTVSHKKPKQANKNKQSPQSIVTVWVIQECKVTEALP